MNITCEKKADILPDIQEIKNKAEGVCVVDWCLKTLKASYLESCGKCVMCRDGILQLMTIVEDATKGKGESDDVEMLVELADVIAKNASCEMSRTAAANLHYSLTAHEDEWNLHIKRKRCTELVCKAYYTVHVKPDTCTGCTECAKVCPADAIAGGEGMIHVINSDKCIRCGACAKACPVGAIMKAGNIKPKGPEAPVPVGSFGGDSDDGGKRRRRRG